VADFEYTLSVALGLTAAIVQGKAVRPVQDAGTARTVAEVGTNRDVEDF